MVWLENLKVAISSLRGNLLRSLLTMLGVIFGVGAVIVMVAIVEGARAEVLEQFESLGSDLIMVWFSPELSRERVTHVEGLTIEDSRAISDQAYLLKAVSPEARSPGDQLIEYGDRQMEAAVFGVQHTCSMVRNISIGQGRFISADDDDGWAKVCVLGAEIPQELFDGGTPLGREITVMGLRVTVVGVLAKKGQAFSEDVDRRVYLPLSTFQKRISGDTRLAMIFAKAADRQNVEGAADQVWEVLMRRHNNQRDFMVDTQGRLLSAIETVIGVFRIVLGCVAGLSLLVGGIGIMNIMLVSVTERTREIGIRKAVGAKRRHIWFQFLTEAATLSGVGGVLGILTGVVMSWLVGKYASQQLPTQVPVWACVMGFAFALGVGIFFGMYPAVRAARLDPIAALHYE